MEYSPDGHLLAVARTGDLRYLPLSEPTEYRVALYNANDEYRYLKCDTRLQERHASGVTALRFCLVDLAAGDPSSWGSGKVIESVATSGARLAPEEEARRAAEAKRQAAELAQRQKDSSSKQSVYLTVLATGGTDGAVRLWDYVTDRTVMLPYFDQDKASLNEAAVQNVVFSSDCRMMAVLYATNYTVMWSFSKKRPKIVEVKKAKEHLTLEAMVAKAKEQKEAAEAAKKNANIALLQLPEEKVDPYEPELPALGHPNEFLRCVSPFSRRAPNKLRTVSMVPGFGPPTTQEAVEEEESKSPLDILLNMEASLPAPFPGSKMTLKQASELLAQCRDKGSVFLGYFLCRAGFLMDVDGKKVLDPNAGLMDIGLSQEERDALDEVRDAQDDDEVHLGRGDNADDEAGEEEEEEEEEDGEDDGEGKRKKKRPGKEKLPEVKEGQMPYGGYGRVERKRRSSANTKGENGDDDADEDNEDDGDDVNEDEDEDEDEDEEALRLLESGQLVEKMAEILAEEDVKETDTMTPEERARIRAANELRVLSMPVQVEYIPPIVYPKRALQVAQQMNLERYGKMHVASKAARSRVEAEVNLRIAKGETVPERDIQQKIDVAVKRAIANVDAKTKGPVSSVTLKPQERSKFDPEKERILERNPKFKHTGPAEERHYDLVGDLLIRDNFREYLFPLAELTQIQLGKFSVELTSSAAAAQDEDCALSLIGSDDKSQLHLVCANKAERDRWVSALRYIFWRVGRNFAASEASPRFLLDAPPAEEFLDVDILATVAGYGSKDSTLNDLAKKKKKAAQQDQVNDPLVAADNLEKLFATSCHMYRIFLGGDHLAGMVEVRVSHRKVYEYYRDEVLQSTVYKGKVMEAVSKPLCLDEREGGVKGPAAQDAKGDDTDLDAVFQQVFPAAKVSESGDWRWINLEVLRQRVRRSVPTRDGKFIMCAETTLPNFNLADVRLKVQDTIEEERKKQKAYEADLDDDPDMAEVKKRRAAEEEEARLRDAAASDDRKDVVNYTVAAYRVSNGFMTRYPVGRHDGLVTDVCVIPSQLVSVSGSMYSVENGGYVFATASEDETTKMWTFGPDDLDLTRQVAMVPLQIIMRPVFLRMLLDTPALARQGTGGQHVADLAQDVDADFAGPKDATAETKAAPASSGVQAEKKTVTPAQLIAQKEFEKRKLEAIRKASLRAVYRSTTIAYGTKATAAPPGPKILQLKRFLQHKAEVAELEQLNNQSD